MTRRTQYTNVMIICLLIGCLLQHARTQSPPADSAAQAAAGEVASLPTGASGAAGLTGDRLSSLLKETGATVKDFGSETTKAAEQAIRAGTRASLALGFLFSQLLNGLSATAATGSGLVASGASAVHGALNGVPVVRVVTENINNLATGLASTIDEVSQNARQSRTKMIQTLRDQLDQSDAGLAGVGASVGAGATASSGASVNVNADATTAAAA